MRGIFFEQVKELMKNDKKIYFLTGDTGFNLVEPLWEIAPGRCINVGVAEQNLIGIAAGLCNAGYTPVVYAITNFIVHRCLEQIRNDICLHRYKIILAGTSTGYDNGGLGATHHMLDDIGCMKALPYINIYSPSGKRSMVTVFNEALQSPLASFIRISKGNYVEEEPVTEANHFIKRTDGEMLVISHGKMVKNCIDAIANANDISLYAMDRIKPLDNARLQELLGKYSRVVVVEDNFNSGLFNSLCQWMIENKINNRIFSISPQEEYEIRIGDSQYLEDKHGLTPVKIAERIDLIRRKEDAYV